MSTNLLFLFKKNVLFFNQSLYIILSIYILIYIFFVLINVKMVKKTIPIVSVFYLLLLIKCRQFPCSNFNNINTLIML